MEKVLQYEVLANKTELKKIDTSQNRILFIQLNGKSKKGQIVKERKQSHVLLQLSYLNV